MDWNDALTVTLDRYGKGLTRQITESQAVYHALLEAFPQSFRGHQLPLLNVQIPFTPGNGDGLGEDEDW